MNEIWLLSIVFGGFLVFGLSENVKGPAIPRMQLDFGLNEGQLGLMLAMNSLGYLVACTFTSYLADKVGIKATSIAAFVSMAAGGVLIGVSNGFQALAASYFFYVYRQRHAGDRACHPRRPHFRQAYGLFDEPFAFLLWIELDRRADRGRFDDGLAAA
ncbi:MFS transporter [Cohnella ginsengisoli]|uniref:MFS transporter n=1 Tax=Cohnella ginsengisoli TaxID=425004 RepID=UPI0030B9093E